MSGSAVPAEAIAQAVAAAGNYLRLEPGQEDTLLAALARSAIDLAEAFCGQALVTRPFEDVLDAGSAWQRLRAAPVARIDGMVGLVAGAAPTVLPPTAYGIDIDAGGIGWARVIDAGGAGQVAVSYSAGLAAQWDGLPAAVAQGLVLLITHLFEHRDGGTAPPIAVAALWRPYRRLRLMAGVHA